MEAEAGGSQTEGSLDLQRVLRLFESFNEPFFLRIKSDGAADQQSLASPSSWPLSQMHVFYVVQSGFASNSLSRKDTSTLCSAVWSQPSLADSWVVPIATPSA